MSNVTYQKTESQVQAMAYFPQEVPEAMRIIGMGNKTEKLHDIAAILQEYGTTYWVHHENGELADMIDQLINAKNVLVRTNLLLQIYENGSFKLPEKAPFENTCLKCHGTGELYLFNRIPKEVKCNRCEGGEVWVRCRSCKGTTRYTSQFQEGGGGINVECRTCKESPADHRGQVKVKCRVCKGTTVAKILVLDHSLKSTTACPVCKEIGFTFPEQEKAHIESIGKNRSPDNPVLAGDLAQKLKDKIDDDNKNFNKKVEIEIDPEEEVAADAAAE